MLWYLAVLVPLVVSRPGARAKEQQYAQSQQSQQSGYTGSATGTQGLMPTDVSEALAREERSTSLLLCVVSTVL